MDKMLDREAAKERLGISLATLERIYKRGEIEAIRVGRSIRIPESAIETYLRTHVLKPLAQ